MGGGRFVGRGYGGWGRAGYWGGGWRGDWGWGGGWGWGIGFDDPFWWGWGAPIYPYSPYYYPYYTAPPVIVNPPPPTQVPTQSYYWYYCPGSKTYYPYVQSCASGWKKVTPKPAGQ